MRLLICTQAVDLEDPVLGFFHRWIEEFAAHVEHIHVICLKEGKHQLPANVSVHSLGKEVARSRVQYISRFFQYVWRLRKEYDSIFVHMNQEYVVLGGIVWRAMGKKIILWRNHKAGSWITDIAGRVAHVVCYTSSAAYVAGYTNAVQMPIGTDTHVFTPGDPHDRSIIFLGRFDPMKKPDVFLEALSILAARGIQFRADIYGEPTSGHEAYARAVRVRYAHLEQQGCVAYHGSVSHEKSPELYRSHAVYVNLTPSGSFDKTLGEALASGCLVVAANSAVRAAIPEKLFISSNSSERVSEAMHAALELQGEERRNIVQNQRSFVEREHSLALLSEKLKILF